ncbi:MAG: hypothetical protein ACREL5_04195 [Gemmatimonadales bacterium]
MTIAALLSFSLLSFSPLFAQDTTQTYPWRLSWFPYPLASPNDGLMGLARAVWFRQSRWDDRVSIADQVAIDAGYSTKDAWLARVQGDFPRLAPGWRLQAFAEAAGLPHYLPGNILGEKATREIAGFDVTRTLHGRLYLALRAEAMHVRIPVDSNGQEITTSGATTETDIRGRLALIYDARDREYDTRSGFLFQGGPIAGSADNGYGGFYLLASVWLPLGERTRLLVRTGGRNAEDGRIDASRIVPAWEDEFVAGGGPESNRGLPVAAEAHANTYMSSIELRHDLKVFPGGALAVIAFVDATSNTDTPSGNPFKDVTPAPGLGVSLRLLRAAAFTVTAARAEGHVRIYAYTGWSW